MARKDVLNVFVGCMWIVSREILTYENYTDMGDDSAALRCLDQKGGLFFLEISSNKTNARHA